MEGAIEETFRIHFKGTVERVRLVYEEIIDIGAFGKHVNSPGVEFLNGSCAASAESKIVRSLIDLVRQQSPHSPSSRNGDVYDSDRVGLKSTVGSSDILILLDKQQCCALKLLLDTLCGSSLDFKMDITYEDLSVHIGEEKAIELSSFIDNKYK
jgi:hypothetical protein